jgi:hypothetical protein
MAEWVKQKTVFTVGKTAFAPKRLAYLEPGSTTPKKKRAPEYSRDLVLNLEALFENEQDT